jgi:hypothetical protein
MLLLLPTYKRIDSLLLVIDSILKAELPDLPNNEKPRLIVLNNFPSNIQIINSYIEKIKVSIEASSNWEISVVNRLLTLPPVENWYSAVFENAKVDEIIFFVGDDDPIIKDSLKKRYEIIKNHDANFIFGRLVHGLIFSDNCSKYYFNSKQEDYTYEINDLDLSDLWKWNSIHLSNHCFKFDSVFINSYLNALSWCEKQTVGELEDKKLFITYYLAISVKLNKGKILGFDSPVIYRGTSLDELRYSKFSIRSWNLGYVAGLAFNLLNNNELKSLKALDETRKHLFEVYNKYYYAIKFDSRISTNDKKKLKKIIHNKSIKINHCGFSGLLIIKYYLKVQFLGLWLKNKIFSKNIYKNIDFDDVYLNRQK